MPAKYCPDCGGATLRLIETTEPDFSGEYKECLTCDSCDNMVYVMRGRTHGPNYGGPEGCLIGLGGEDRRAYNEEKNRLKKEFHHREGGGD